MKKALLITNLNARTVSQRLKQVIVKALSADLDLEVADTRHRQHATELARQAADRDFDLVISFGGDGTMNEALNGLVGTGTALTVLPGGMANVLCRTLGVPIDIVEATGLLLNLIRSPKVRRMHVGRTDDRYFLMSCGVGVDAATVRRTEANPQLKRRYRDWYFLYAALQTSFSEYRGRKPNITMTADDVCEEVLIAIVSNLPEFTYFKNLPIRVTPDATIEGGLDVFAMKRFPMHYIPRLLWGVFKSGAHVRYSESIYVRDLGSASFVSSGEPFPIQVDGEYIGERTDLKVELVEEGIGILA